MLCKSLLTKLVLSFLLITSATCLEAGSLKPLRHYGPSDILKMSLEEKQQHNALVINDFYELFQVDLIMKIKNKEDKESMRKILNSIKKDCVKVSQDYEVMLSEEYGGARGVRQFYEDAVDGIYKRCLIIVNKELTKNSSLSKYMNLVDKSLPLNKVLKFQSNPYAVEQLRKMNPKNITAIYSFKALDSMGYIGSTNKPTESITDTININWRLAPIVMIILSLLFFIFLKLRG